MDTEKKLLGLLQDAAVLIHRYYYETNMPIKNACEIVQILAKNYAKTIDKVPEDEFTLEKVKRTYNIKDITYAWCKIDDWVSESDKT